MTGAVLFAAGFATGWALRSTVESSRGATVQIVSTVLYAVDRARRLLAIEREHMEDLLAEARALLEERRAQEEAESRTAPEMRETDSPSAQVSFVASSGRAL